MVICPRLPRLLWSLAMTYPSFVHVVSVFLLCPFFMFGKGCIFYGNGAHIQSIRCHREEQSDVAISAGTHCLCKSRCHGSYGFALLNIIPVFARIINYDFFPENRTRRTVFTIFSIITPNAMHITILAPNGKSNRNAKNEPMQALKKE